MLAATLPERSPYPNLFQLALELLSAERALPAPLERHIAAVSRQAQALVLDPSAIDRNTLPEAVELALQLKKSNELRAALRVNNANITSEMARRLLTIEKHAAES